MVDETPDPLNQTRVMVAVGRDAVSRIVPHSG